MVSGFLFPPVKRPVREAVLSPPTYSAEVKINWSYNFTPPYTPSCLVHGLFYLGETERAGVGWIHLTQGQVVPFCVVKAYGGVEMKRSHS
jgi:hypothetical protein